MVSSTKLAYHANASIVRVLGNTLTDQLLSLFVLFVYKHYCSLIKQLRHMRNLCFPSCCNQEQFKSRSSGTESEYSSNRFYLQYLMMMP